MKKTRRADRNLYPLLKHTEFNLQFKVGLQHRDPLLKGSRTILYRKYLLLTINICCIIKWRKKHHTVGIVPKCNKTNS